MSTDYVISEISVTGSFKSWTEPNRSNVDGVSGGSEIQITAVPENESSFWTTEEAKIVSLDIRMQIHIMLMADAQMRGVAIPANAATAMNQYREKIKKLKKGDEVEYKDIDLPVPNPTLVT